MKVRFYFYELKSHYGHPPSLCQGSTVVNAFVPVEGDFNKYLLSSIDTDFSENQYGHVDLVLDAVGKVESGELAEFEWEGQGFTAHITRDRVRFEHSIFSECPEWPIWCCTLAQYKAALQGYRRFLDMPRSIDTELIIELPEGEARCD